MSDPQSLDIGRMRQLIGNYLRSRGESARSFSIRAGLSSAVVGHIMRGRNKQPTSETLLKIAGAMHITTDELCGREVSAAPDLSDEPDERRAASEFARANRVPAWAIREVLEDEDLVGSHLSAEDWYYAMRLRARRRGSK